LLSSPCFITFIHCQIHLINSYLNKTIEEGIMIDMKDTIHRRGFLGALAAGAATLGLATIPAAEALATPPPGNIATEFEALCKKLKTRKHRQLFDATQPNHGLPVIWSWAFLTTNNATGTRDDDLGVIVVLRHEAIPFAMEDRLWEKYKFGEAFNVEDNVTKKPATRNVVTNIKPEDLPLPEMALEVVQKRGIQFCVCDLAITVYSSKMAKEMNRDPDETKKDWISGVLPGIHLLPSGVWAVNRAQEFGFTYCFAGI
jgi:intracellular sulfur oxidation DsrE/DsrF family protein